MKSKRRFNSKAPRRAGSMRLLGGFIGAPVRRDNTFGPWIDLGGRIPEEADCIMVLVNSGGGLNAGYPKPVGFLKLTHQLYLRDIEELLKAQAENDAQSFSNGTRWITVVPIRSKEYVDVWTRQLVSPPNNKDERPCA